MLHFIRFVCLLILIGACHSPRKNDNINFIKLKEPLIDANKKYIKKESDEIDQYITIHNYNMITTGTGIRYMIYKKGDGALAQIGEIANINYTISLLDGTQCYSSKNKVPKEFKIGHDQVESGLHELVTYMHVGDKITAIIPSYLAFGLTGDGNKIPPHASVVYDLELMSLR